MFSDRSWWRICLECRRPRFDSWVGKIPWRRDRLPTGVFLGFPCGSAGKETTCNAGDLGSIAGLGRTPGEGKGYSLQYSGLENSMDCIAHGVTKSRTRLSNFHFHSCIGVWRLCVFIITYGDNKLMGIFMYEDIWHNAYSQMCDLIWFHLHPNSESYTFNFLSHISIPI